MNLQSKDSRGFTCGVENIFFIVALIFGALACWLFRFTNSFGSDGTSYIDMAYAFLRQDWNMFTNAQWSPLYPVFLAVFFKIFQPSPYWEYPVAHAANFFIYGCGLVAFRFFLSELFSYRTSLPMNSQSEAAHRSHTLAALLGYTIFISTAVEWVKIKDLMADMCVVVFYFLIAGLMLRIKQKKEGIGEYLGLGVCLGLAYLAKAVMLPLAFIFLAVTALIQSQRPGTWVKWLLALSVAGMIAAPWIQALSHQKGRLTIGDAGKLVYAMSIHGKSLPTFGDAAPLSMQEYKHPPRKISEDPEIYEFSKPIGGTYPLWYDISYWLDGIETHFDLKRILQSGLIWGNYTVRNIFCGYLPGALWFWFLIMIGRSRESRKQFFQYWFLIAPALFVIGLYALTHGDLRYIAAPFVVLWMISFLSLPLLENESGRAWLKSLGGTLVILTFLTIGYNWATLDLLAFRPDLERQTFGFKSHGGLGTLARLFENNFSQNPDYEIAEAMHQLGIQEGDEIAIASDPYLTSLWVRLAHLKIIAEIPARARRKFSQADSAARERIFGVLRNAGARALVATELTAMDPKENWHQLPHSKYYVYLL